MRCGPGGRAVALLCWLAGGCDASTGLLLVVVPGSALHLMGVAPAPAEPIYLRFIGVFVFGVGAAYLYPWAGASELLCRRVATVLEVTALLRLAVGTFVLASVSVRALAPAWLLVAATDLGLAAVQLVLLRRTSLAEARGW